jgi:NTP pyrophosphatase (non-canonical NTP hydrolase)
VPVGDNDRLADLQRELAQFRDERDWLQFHSLKDLAAAVAIEAGELQELFLWVTREQESQVLGERRREIEDEVADVLIQLLNFVAIAEIDPVAVASTKVAKNAIRYPAEKVRGTARKALE